MARSKNFASTGTVLILSAWIAFVSVGCASATKDMGYTQYASPEDWAEKTKTGSELPLAKTADVWSDVKNFSTNAGPVGVQSKFLEQQGTTCTFEVKFTNAGAKTISERVSLQSKHNEKVFSHRFTDVTVNPGKAVWYEMEKRECPLKWGTSKEMNSCAECSPTLVFLK